MMRPFSKTFLRLFGRPKRVRPVAFFKEMPLWNRTGPNPGCGLVGDRHENFAKEIRQWLVARLGRVSEEARGCAKSSNRESEPL